MKYVLCLTENLAFFLYQAVHNMMSSIKFVMHLFIIKYTLKWRGICSSWDLNTCT